MLRYTGSATSYDPPKSSDRHSEYEFGSQAFPPAHLELLPAVDRRSRERATYDPVVTKLENFGPLDCEEIDALKSLSRNPKIYRAEQILVHEGSTPDHVYIIIRGLACRYKLLPGGRRQILSYLIPGDLCDAHFVLFSRPDYSVALLSDSLVARVPVQKMADVIARFAKIERALSLAALIDSAILREWLLNVGQRDAIQKLSHLFCEMAMRLKLIGHVCADGSFELPVNQAALADSTGLTSVHINRTLQRLRKEGLIRLCHRRLSILNPDRLAAIAGFEGNYLHIRS